MSSTAEIVIRNARIIGSSELQDLAVSGGRFIAAEKAVIAQDPSGTRIIDVGGRLVSPPLIDAHMHLDSALTFGQPRPNSSGTLHEGIEIWKLTRETLTADRVHENATTVTRWMAAHGVGHIRCHVDVSDPQLTALHALLSVRQELADVCTVELVAFPQDGVYAHPDGKKLLERAVDLGCDVVGGAPHLEVSAAEGAAAIRHAFDLARIYGLGLDFHCDETDDPSSRHLETIISETRTRGWGGRVSASHCTAMAAYHPIYRGQLMTHAAEAGVAITLSPMVNALLQGRHDPDPRRGLAPLKELRRAGVSVGIGHDSILDAWCPFGTGNMLQIGQLTAILAQMSAPHEIDAVLEVLTESGAKTVGKAGYGLAPGHSADFLVHDHATPHEAIRMAERPRYVFREGRETFRTSPQQTWHGQDGANTLQMTHPGMYLPAIADTAIR